MELLTKEQIAVILGNLSTPTRRFHLSLDASPYRNGRQPLLTDERPRLHYAIIEYDPRYMELAVRHFRDTGGDYTDMHEHCTFKWERTVNLHEEDRNKVEEITVNRLFMDFLEYQVRVIKPFPY